ncbi:hypothetical protein AB3S75_041569 [Citrus x aurantiifolia]
MSSVCLHSYLCHGRGQICSFLRQSLWLQYTTIAFTRLHQHETDELTGSVQTPSSPQRQPIEVCFAYADVDAAYKRAVENGAVPVSEPEDKEWGQKVGYVRDINGIVVRMGSYVQASK